MLREAWHRSHRPNHSCLPNAHHRWNENIGVVTVHVVKDIALGEEIVITYISLCRDPAPGLVMLGISKT